MLLFTEGFDWTTTIADLSSYNKWFDNSGLSIANTTASLRFGAGTGNYLSCTSNSHYLRKAIGSNLASGVIGFAMRRATNSGYNNNLLVLLDTTSNVQMGVKTNSDGTFSIFRTSHANILGTSTFALTGNTWVYIELKWKISDSISSGDVVLYADGTAILTLAGASDTKNTANAYATHFCLFSNTPAVTSPDTITCYIDDLYLADLTGSYNNAALGSVRVCTLFPSGDGNSSQLTGSDGNSTNNSLLVDETSPNDDTDYVEHATASNKDLYAFGDLPGTISTVYGFATNIIAKKSDAGAKTAAPVVRSNSTDYDGATVTLSTGYVAYQEIHETDPNTASPATPAAVNSMQFGFKVVA